MKRLIGCRITGVSPLLHHRFPMDPDEGKDLDKKTPDEQAEVVAYRDPEGNLMVPGVNVQRAFVAGGMYVKVPRVRTATKLVAACVMVTPQYLLLNQKKYTIDSRPVVIPSTKGRIIRHRPCFEEWELEFTIEYDDSLLTQDQMRELVDATGSRVGLCDFRPEKKGPFGRFAVTHWEPDRADKPEDGDDEDADEDEDG